MIQDENDLLRSILKHTTGHKNDNMRAREKRTSHFPFVILLCLHFLPKAN